MATRIRTLNFLPEIFQTPTNAQFLAATLDQVVAQPETKKIQGYIGSKFGYGINAKDYYVTEPTKVRKDYQLDPGIVFTKKNEAVAQDFISYPGILDALKLEGGLTKNNDRLFNSEFYSWDSFTNLDKIINFNQYYWIPNGPDSVIVSSETVFSSNDYIVKSLSNGYSIVPLTASEGASSTNPTIILLRGGTYTFEVNQDSQFWIQGEPGVTGYSATQPNLQTRDVYGVNNNGASVGIVTFNVPPKDAQDEYNFPGNNLVDVVSTLPFSEINGKPLSELGNIDGISSLENLTVMFYNTGDVNEIGYISNFFDSTAYDVNNGLVGPQTVTVTSTSGTTNLVTCANTNNLTVGGTVTFTGSPFGGLSAYSPTLPSTIYYITSIVNGTQFTVSTQQPDIALATQLVAGKIYIITSLGTTDFTIYGAPTNVVGTIFTATSSGIGTGTARELTTGLNFEIGETYTITSLGTTDFTLMGAASNTVGLTFIATGSGVVTAGSFVPGLNYVITSLGTTDWNAVAGTTGLSYIVGDIITAATSGSGTGQANQMTTGSGTGTAYVGATNAVLSSSSGSMILNYNLGLYEEGYYTNVSDYFYRITYIGDPSNPVIRLVEDSQIPTNEKITAVYGTQWISRNFYKNDAGTILLIPYITAPLDTLYYQDGTSPNKVGTIRIIESNILNTLDVERDILGKTQFTATNGVVFTNGLKVKFQGDVVPRSYLTGEYYVEGVGTSIELLPVENFVSPEGFTSGKYDPWDTIPWDTAAWEGDSYIPVTPDYITISRNSIDKNAWSRSNRWFHIDVINATATYNNNPNLVTLYTLPEYKAKRPIIEFYPNLKLFNLGIEGKNPVDFIDQRTTDAFGLVAGQQNYYPDVEVYTKYAGTISATNYSPTRSLTSYSLSTNEFTVNSTAGFRVNDLVVFNDTPPALGITTGSVYYITEILTGTTFKISSTRGGASVGFTIDLPDPPTYTGPWSMTWTPQSTTITISADDVIGAFTVGQYITDSTNQLPKNSQIVAISGTTIITLEVEWEVGSSVYIPITSNASLIATDTTNDNYALFEGSTIIFAADNDLNVRNKIYVSRFSDIAGSSIPVITLTEIQDGNVLPEQQTVALRGYFNQGKEFWFNGDNWIDGQQKTDVNQPPLFDIFDSNGISFGNSDIYQGTSFIGCKLFGYGIGTGPDDSILGFPIRYSSVENLGDISFDVSLNLDTFDYVSGTSPITQKVNTGYVYQYNTPNQPVRQIGWQTAVAPSVQYQLFEFEYDVLKPTLEFVCDINTINSTDIAWPVIKVAINNVILSDSEYTVSSTNVSTTITLNSSPVTNTIIQIALLSNQTSQQAFYSIPINLNNNPLNADIVVANVGDIRGQYQSMFYNNPNTTGEVFGSNNFRDLGNMVPWGDKIIQNSASLVLPGTLLRKTEHNLFNALMFNSKEYVKFKNLLVYTVQNADYQQRYDAATMLDDALDYITATKTDSQPFFWSDMIPNKAAYIVNTYSFANSLDVSIYPLSKTYDFTKANYYGVLVYLTRAVNNILVTRQLIKNTDYTISTDSPSLTITLDLLPGDVITIKEYNQTYGSYVPNTPTKLGLYPAHIPQVILDSNYSTPTYFIKGHDGSYTKLYGEYDPNTGILVDFRDQVLLEFELRIYNNLKLSATIPIQEYEIVPGFFRETDYTYEEWLYMYSTAFLNWVGQNRLDFKTQIYNAADPYTYNYSQSGNALNKKPISQGYWRGIYQYFYDTTNPNTAPWEMLGFTEMPSWWTSRYGPAPYTSDNLVLWEDLANGINWNNGNPIVIEQAVRPGLLDVIPVDSAGNLLEPLNCIVGNYNQNLFRRDWKVGDDAPVEFSYRRSSTYPFDLVRLMALMKPAQFFNLAVDLDNYKYNEEFNQYLVNDRSHLVIKDVEIYGDGTAKTSYLNWIVDYEKQIGIAATENIKTLFDNLDVRLIYRLAGFSDKILLQFFVEKGTPNSNNASLLIPDESYSVLLYDNQPFNRVMYSSIIVQQGNAGEYIVYGNSQSSAYFTTLKPKFSGNWKTFEVEDATVRITTEHFEQEQIIPYGTKFYSIQEVAQFVSDYGAYLEFLGMQFTEQENELTINWDQMIAEFLYWSQTGWEAGSIVTLNPAAKILVINKDSNIVQPLTLQQSNFVLNQNLYPVQLTDLAIVRDDTLFSVTALNDGDTISYGQFNLSNFEHGVVFDNVTVFGDIIYNLITGLRQTRIAVRGTKSAAWNGTVNAAGFIYNQNNIKEWNKFTKYTKGEIVIYKNKYWVATKVIQASEIFKEEDWKRTDYNEIQKGLLANPSTRSYESTLYYDTNQTNLEKDADQLSFSLIGYRPRDYLALADLTDITQINVYKNLIKNKGTRNSTNAFKGANLPQGGIDYDVYENWAIKSSQFGGVLNNNFIEVKLNEKYLTGNPSIVGLTNGVYNLGVQQEIPLYSIFNYERPVTDVNILSTISPDEPSVIYPTAGYVNFNDVKLTSFFYSQLPIGVNKNGIVIPIQEFYVRDYAWVANYKERWEVFTPSSIGRVVNAKNNLNETVTLTFDVPHNLRQYDPFAIVNFEENIDGYYIATIVIDPYRVMVNKVLDPSIKTITGQGVGLRLKTQRVATPADIASLPLLNTEFTKNTVWVDTNTDGSWGVYRKGINYQLQDQLTKTSSQSLGSAVAIGENLGYLIGDADDGKVYRYTFNDLTQTYQLVQTLTGGASFGSTIAYADDLYAIAETTGTTRNIKLYQLQNTTESDDLVLYQTLSVPGVSTTNWGQSISISGDKYWIYVSDIVQNTVYVYRRSHVTTPAGNFTIGQTYTIAELGDTDFKLVGATTNVVGISFIATGVGSGTGVAIKSTYVEAAIIDADALSLTTAGDNFGTSISTDYSGDRVVIGAPNQNYGTIDNWGYAYIFNRLVQNIEIQNNVTPTTLQLAWTPTTVQKTVSATNGAPNYTITLNDVVGLNVNDPVVFTATGSGLSGTNIVSDQIYYVHSIPSGTEIKIKETRFATSPYAVTTNASVSATLHVQTESLLVYRNGTIVDDNNYAVINDKLLYTGALSAGDIVTVSSNEIIYTQTLTTEESPQIGSQFGISLDANTYASEILIGAPFQLNSQIQEGAVYRFTDGGAKYGTIIGTGECNVTTARKILINGYLVYLAAGNAEDSANIIKASNITNVTATAINNKLVISLINIDLAPNNEKLSLSVDDYVTLQELGISIFTKTQEILCPHTEGPTQFGTVVKFNQYDSFIASAPAGTRYSATTFDFIDDENQDNDTIFDNNATQWIDQSPNFGAVYMFDFIPQYQSNILNPGKFIYAQSVNSPNIVYSPFNTYDQDTDVTENNQPRYGTALDFNGYSLIVGTPGDTGSTSGTTYSGSITTYNNILNVKDWTLFRYSAPVVDVNKLFNIQLFSAETNNTLINMDYIDPWQGKILGAARENIDVISNDDPATYNNTGTAPGGIVWGAAQIGKIWFNTSNIRYVNYHQNNDVVYNSQYWGTLFPGSDVAIYTWIASNVLPADYQGPGTPYQIDSYSIQYVINSAGALTPVYYYWVRDTNIIFADNGKTLADSIIASYIENPKNSGVSYFAPLLPNVYGLYNSGEYINATDSVLHLGFATGKNDDPSHQQFNLIRDGYASDFLPGVPLLPEQLPENLYDRMLDSLCGVDETGQVVPNPYLPRAVQTGVLARPRQSFFFNRFTALQNYLQYANTVLAQYPISEIRQSLFLNSSGPFYETADYWQYVNWWAPGYDNNTKSAMQVSIYADLSTLTVPVGTIVTVLTNNEGKSETYVYEAIGNWNRIGLENGTIEFKSSLWDYASVRLGYGDNFFDTDIYDQYPSEETRKIIRALNEEIYVQDLLIHRNKSLILLFEYIQSETSENQNYLPWLNKTSLIDVSHTIRELRPIEVFQTDNQEFLAGYLNEVKPYHVVIKEFVFKYTGEELYTGNITDFDLPAKYNKSLEQFVSPQLVYSNPSGSTEFLPNNTIWQEPEYSQWFENKGVSITGEKDFQLTTLASYISLNTASFAVDNAQGFPTNGVITIGTEKIGYSSVDRATNIISGLTRGVDGTNVSTHIPGALIYTDLPPVLLLNGGRGYTEPPKVVAYLDTTIYPAPTRTAVLEAVMSLDSVLRIDVIDPGQGYAALPTIKIDPAITINFSSEDVNPNIDTIRLYAPLLETGDLVQYKVGANSTAIGGLENNQWYYVNVLETVPTVVVGLYTNYLNSLVDHDRIAIYNAGTGVNHSLNLGARASAISTAYPIRENDITLRFDRTTYNSDIIEWIAGRYYGAFYAGSYSNSESVASSSITLQSTQPPIADILASAQGVAFEITDLRNERVITYSSFVRNVQSTENFDNSIRLILQDDGSGNPNASGGTLGFYVGMPIKFKGATGTSNLINDTVYYVNSIISLTDFTISANSSGSPILTLNDFNPTTVGGLECYVGEVTDTAVITVNYPGIRNITATTAITNKVTIPFNITGTGGTEGFYIDLPIFFTGTNNTLPQNGVFGGIVENQVYYVTTVVDEQTFTMSTTTNPLVFTVLSTDAGTDAVSIDGDTSKLYINEPIIFNTMVISGSKATSFGNIVSGKTYYVSAITSPSTFQISESINGPVFALSTVSAANNTSSLVTSQKDTVPLDTATGSTMVVNISLPVSPGQVNGQLFTMYETSEQYPNLVGNDGSLITRGVASLIGQRIIDGNPVDVNRIVLTNFNAGTNVALLLTNLYVNMPMEISEDLFDSSSYLTLGTTYYIVDMDIIEVEVTNTSQVTTGVTVTAGNFVTGSTYIIVTLGTTDFTLIGATSNTIGLKFTATGPGVGTGTANVVRNQLTCDTTESLFADMPISFTGAGIGGVNIDVEYYVKEVVDDHHFTITNTPGGLEIVVQTANGLMTGIGLPYIKLATTIGGTDVNPGDTEQAASINVASPAVVTVTEAPQNGNTIIFRNGNVPNGVALNTTYYVRNASSTTFNISLTPAGALVNSSGSSGSTTMINTTSATMDQTPSGIPEFDVSYILGGYRAIISSPGSGYAIDNKITISGTDMGGVSPENDLTLTVNSIDSLGEITSVICAGTVPGQNNQYYLKVISPTEFEIYQNALMTVPVSGLGLPYKGVTQSIVNNLTSGTETLTLDDASGFAVNDAVVFTGNLTPTVGSNPTITAGKTYYITSIVGNDITISDEPGGTNVDILTTVAADFTIAKSGSFVLLPEPFIFNQSIVKYNNRVYVCIISNNDDEFVFGKWELLTSGDRRLNAMDRVIGYYDPTSNMPGVDLSQLFEGITYPNSIYLGNPFQPDEQFPIDTILQDQPFYPTDVDIKAVAWDGTKYFAPADTPEYSAVITSENTNEWEISKLANTPLGVTDIIYAGGFYIITTNNNATPIFRSNDGVTWTTNSTGLNVASISLNSVSYLNSLWVAVGENIVSSDDTYIWRERFEFSNPSLENILYGVLGISLTNYTGFIAVGKGQQFDYSTGITLQEDINLIVTSTDGIIWNQLTPVSAKGLYGIAYNANNIVVVGEDGIIYTSTNGNNWLGVNEVKIISANSVANELNVTNTSGFTVGDIVYFSESFNVIVAGTPYYVVNIISSTQLQVSLTSGGLPITLNSNDPLVNTYMHLAYTSSLRDVAYSNGVYIAVGDNGLIKTSTTGSGLWNTQISGTTKNLRGITYNSDDGIWITVGDDNTILTSVDNGITWIASSIFAPQSTIYDVQGAEFTFGYGPEELVPGVVTDNLTMIVATRPGTNWNETIYQHVGYNVASLELSPQSGTQITYSFDVANVNNIQTPAKLSVFVINGTTGLCTTIYEGLDYSIDWITLTVTLNTPLAFTPVADRLRIDIYEVGNGSQLVKASTKTDPIRINETTGWNEIYVNCNYSGEIYQGSGVIRPGTSPIDAVCVETDAVSNSILCEDVSGFVLNNAITFQGTTFGGIQEDTVYYVKTISYVTNRITISTTFNGGTGTAGPTLSLTDGSGYMTAIISTGTGLVWTDPIIYHNGNKLLLGTTGTVTRTKAAPFNTITCSTTSSLAIGERVVFSDTMFGTVVQPQITYYVASIYDFNEFRISENSSATVAGSFVIGKEYVIIDPGTTNFTLIGASSNVAGTIFTATGNGTGNGTAWEILQLSDATGGAEFISNDYTFGIADNGISASLIFATGAYDATVDYITYTLFGETVPIQYGYTIPEMQLFTGDGSTTTFSLVNFVGDDNANNAIVEVNGLRQDISDYTINTITNEIIFGTAPLNGDTIAVTTYNQTDRQYFNTQYNITGSTVAKITNINNNIVNPIVVSITATTSGTNVITCIDTSLFVAGQTIVFKGISFGGLAVDGTVYFVRNILSSTTFTIEDENGNIIVLSNGSGSMFAEIGGQPSVRIITVNPHNFSSPVNGNQLIRIDGVFGSTQLNNKTYYVHVIDSYTVDLYEQPYDSALAAINYPVTNVSTYTGGGYIFNNDLYTIVTVNVTSTTTSPTLGNRLIVADTSMLIEGTPIIFTGTSLGGISLNTTYYIKEVATPTAFTISATRGGDEVILANDSGSMNATQWEQTNVDRLWVTVNGYRVPSSSLVLNENNQLSILTEINPADSVIITSMMPSATPNEEVYLLNVEQNNAGVVFRANTQTRTWLTQPLSNTSSTIYVQDVTRLTDVITQNVTAPTPVNNIYNIGLTSDKNIISSVTVVNNTTGQTISSSNFNVAVISLAPVLQITDGSYINPGDSLTIIVLEGNLIYVNGEQIKFTSVDLVNNTLTGLQRGTNGTGEQQFIPKYAEVYGLLSNNQMSDPNYSKTWNSNVYSNDGDPLQISVTDSAIFLRTDIS
jgi:hypothetical protein